MESMLEFNPYLRKSAAELLEHPFFADIRVKQNEMSSKTKLLLEIDKDESYDPESSKFTLSDDKIEAMIYDFVNNLKVTKC